MITIWSRQEGKYPWLGLLDCNGKSRGDAEEEGQDWWQGGGVLGNVDEISSRDLVHMHVQARTCACAHAHVCK